MDTQLINQPCPHCEQDTLVCREVERTLAIAPRFTPYIVSLQLCSCENSIGITDLFVAVDENGDKEIVYEYAATVEMSSNPVFDEIYGRF